MAFICCSSLLGTKVFRYAARVAAHKPSSADLWSRLTARSVPMPDVMVVLQVSCPV